MRDAAGAAIVAPADTPRFDHDEEGTPLGLLLASGVELGGGDRMTIDPLILPADILTSIEPFGRNVTVFHHFDGGAGAERRAWYSRDPETTINRLLQMSGHHLQIGLARGFRPNEGGYARYRGFRWRLPNLIRAPHASGLGVLGNGAGKPLVSSGAAGS